MPGRFLAIVGVVAVTMLGNLRLQASEVQAASPVASQSVQRSGSAPRIVRVRDMDEAVDAAGELQLVPAIYAWDPAVRYVYFRHVTKWM